MPELIVVGFEGRHRASEVLGQLLALDAQWTIDLRDAVTVYRTDDGRLRLDQSVQPTTGEGAAWGGLLGGMLGALLAAPFTMGASAAAAAAAVGAGAVALGVPGAALGAADSADWKAAYGIPDDFVRQVGGMVQPGQSAVFALLRSADPVRVAEQFRGYGGTILRTNLSTDDARRLQRAIAADRPAHA